MNIIDNKPWPAKGLLDTLIAIICAAITSIIAVVFKHYYTALILIIVFMIVALAILITFYIQLRLCYSHLSDIEESMIDANQITKDTYEQQLRQFALNTSAEGTQAGKDKSDSLSSRDLK